MINTFPFGQEEMLWPCVRLLIAAGETKGYEWAATYLEEGHGILPRPKNIRNPEISTGRLFGSHKTENIFRFFSCPHSFLLFILITRTISVRERVDSRGHNLLKKELPSDTERVQSVPIYWRYFSKCRNLSKKHLLIKRRKVSSSKAP